MEFLSTLFYFIIVIGILVVIHEWGHFIAARASGMRCDIFSFGMGNRLFGWHRKSGFTFGNLAEDYDYAGTTDYRFSLFPLGGYVKIAGMVDESFDTSYVTKAPQADEFRSKNFFQKFITLSGGVIMNVLLAIVIFSAVLYIKGEEVIKSKKIAYVAKKSIANDLGFKTGDVILSINGKETSHFGEIKNALISKDLNSNVLVKVERDSTILDINVLPSKVLKDLSEQKPIGLLPSGFVVFFKNISKDSPASKAGLKIGDTVLSLNSIPIVNEFQFIETIAKSKNVAIELVFKRKNQIDTIQLKTNKDGVIGVELDSDFYGEKATFKYGIFESIQKGTSNSFEIVGMFVGTFQQIFKGNMKLKNAVGGPIMIAKQSKKAAEMGIDAFLIFTASVSMSLAFFNILPFPALDGGHLVIVTIEAIIRRELPVKAKLAIQNIGFFILLALMAFVIIMDFMR